MGYSEILTNITLEAGQDLSTKQYKFMTLASDGQIDPTAAAGGKAIGVLQNKPNAAGKAATVTVFGVSKMVAGGNVSAGALIKSDANGNAVAATAATVDTSDTGAASDPVVGSFVMGYALESAQENDIFAAFIFPMGAVPTTAA